MLKSLNSGAAGLNAHQTGLDVIGNNISNVNTTAFKPSTVSFNDMLYQNLSNSKAATDTKATVNAKQSGTGSLMAATSKNLAKSGSAKVTGDTLDFRIDGENFFVVHDGTQEYYTKDGSFATDVNGNLVTRSKGLYVYGWSSTDGTTVNTAGGIGQLNIYKVTGTDTYSEATTAMTIKGNIGTYDSNMSTEAGKNFSTSVYAANGDKYSLTFNVTKAEADNTYTIALTSVTDPNGTKTEVTDNSFTVTFDTNGALSAVNGTVGATTQTLTVPGAGTTVTVDLSSLTNTANTTSIYGVPGDSNGGTGYALGNRTGFTVDENGILYATYGNGANRVLGQIATARFANANGLDSAGDNLYQVSINSGAATIQTVNAGGGNIYNGQLEMSGTDLSTEMVDMILMQRGFQANSRVITVSDTILDTLQNLKR